MNPSARTRKFLSRGPLLGLVASVAIAATGSRSPTSSAADTAEKPYALYLGAEVSVQQGGQFRRVTDVNRSAVVTIVDGKTVAIPMGRTPVNLKIDPALKLSDRSAIVTGLTGERCYTPQNDPWRKFEREQPGYSSAAAIVSAEASYNVASTTLAAAQLGGQYNMAGSVDEARRAVSAAVSGVDSAVFAAGSDNNSAGRYVGRTIAELDKELFDAMEVTFAVSSERPLERPYLVLVTTFHAPDARPDAVKNWIYAKALEPIGPKPIKVRVVQGGFPPGFELKGYSVHLYNQGAEVATNVAPKRVALSRDEAFQYVLVDHLSSHKGATMPPTTTLTHLPPDLREQVARAGSATYYVKVSAVGRGTAVFSDAGCTRPVDDALLRRLVVELRFKPALEKGKPVDGVYPLSLNQLAPW